MNNKLFTFLNPTLEFIDSGRFFREPFRWLYVIIGVLNLLCPIALLYKSIDSKLFEYMPGKYIFAFILVFIIITGLSWMSYLLWMNRKEKLKILIKENSDFVAIPVVAHFTQTLGEWIGLYIGIGGCLISLLLGIFGANQLPGTDFLPAGVGIGMCILYPIYGFLTVVFARLLAELYRALASIANNTKKESSQTSPIEEIIVEVPKEE